MFGKAASVFLSTKLYSGRKVSQVLKGKGRANGGEARPWALFEYQQSLKNSGDWSVREGSLS